MIITRILSWKCKRSLDNWRVLKLVPLAGFDYRDGSFRFVDVLILCESTRIRWLMIRDSAYKLFHRKYDNFHSKYFYSKSYIIFILFLPNGRETKTIMIQIRFFRIQKSVTNHFELSGGHLCTQRSSGTRRSLIFIRKESKSVVEGTLPWSIEPRNHWLGEESFFILVFHS